MGRITAPAGGVNGQRGRPHRPERICPTRHQSGRGATRQAPGVEWSSDRPGELTGPEGRSHCRWDLEVYAGDMAKDLSPARAEQIEQAIKVVRGQRVLLDSDLAQLYGVITAALNQAVKRNPP